MQLGYPTTLYYKDTKNILNEIKTKIENGEAVSSDDFEDVFDSDVTPN